ncbi:hypothetical protein [Massilia sp. H6]|uniref:hypothetical protein n=1 Tax=Massilia sp. H6 TaxID=2970464 RepID=UPI0021679D6C|nr:hypothetical protein [Massilia sp. H6]UVW27159.1 hypothetical protein NRS07_11330 [Massilia sp. H6]
MPASARQATILKNLIAVVAGFGIGSLVNMGLIGLGARVIAPPAGSDLATMEGLQASMHLFGPEHFVFPLLAHALGTLVGALVAARIAASRPLYCALVVGLLFMAGGLASVVMLPGPLWFETLDLLLAYLPMAWLGWRLAPRTRRAG